MKHPLKQRAIALAVSAGLTLSAFVGTSHAQDPINVVTTVGMITDVVANVGGARVTVNGLMGAGVDPHLYRPTASDVGTLQDADIVFRGGLHLEGKMDEIFDRISTRIPVYAMADDLTVDQLLDFPQFPEFHDPHIWFDVSLWSSGVGVVERALSEYDPVNAAEYAANAAAYQEKLTALDTYILEAVATIPEGQRTLITAHDAFKYFGRRYGITVEGLQGISTEAEAGVQDVQNLVALVVENQIPAIFVETSVPARTIEAVIEAARAQGWDVQIGGTLYSDAPGDAGTLEGTYIGMVLHNVIVMVTSLGGELPPLPDALADYQLMLES
ncbi:MAG: zinc ABC transporter substrate-binding protein [Chloroflexota bacterium]|nr:zinc ABC transporter substrate-binding protein [Chloroflexota bacterium]